MIEEEITTFKHTQPIQFPQKLLPLPSDHKHFSKYQPLSTLSLSTPPIFTFHHQTLAFASSHEIKLLHSPFHYTKAHQVSALAFKNEGLLAYGQSDGSMHLLELAQKRVIRTHPVFDSKITFIDFQEQMVIGGEGLKWFDLISNEIVTKSNTGRVSAGRAFGEGWLIGNEEGRIYWVDGRERGKAMVFDGKESIQGLVALRGGISFASIEGYELKIWDVRKSSFVSVQGHQKMITGLEKVCHQERLMTVGLDGHLKVFDVQDLKVTYQEKLSGPIMGLKVSEEDKQIALGLSDGSLVVKKYGRSLVENEKEESFMPDFLKENEGVTMKAYQYYNRGQHISQTQYDLKFTNKRKKLSKHDTFLKKFQYKKALLSVIDTQQTDLIMSVIEEIILRESLPLALGHLDEEELNKVLSFIARKIKHAHCNDILLTCLQVLVSSYQETPVFQEMHDILQEEMAVQENMIEIEGLLETIMNANQMYI